MSEMPPDDGSAEEEAPVEETPVEEPPAEEPPVEEPPAEEPPADEPPAEESLPPFPPEPVDSFLQGEAASTGVGNLGTYRFCFALDGRYWGQQDIQSPSTEGAQVTANQLARLLQDMLRRLGYGDHTVSAYPC